MRRLLDLVLIVAILLAVGVGAYAIGRKVDRESNSLASHDPELNQTTVAARVHTTHSNQTPLIVGIGVGGTAVALLLGSMVNSFVRSRRRARWHAT